MRIHVGLSGLLLEVVLMMGCGSGSNTAELRFVLASPGAPGVNILIDGKTVATNMGPGSSTGYLMTTSGSRHIQLEPANGSTTPILDEKLSISNLANQTLFITGPVAAIKPIVLSDGGTTAVTGDGNVRVFNASSTIGPSDVYIVPAGTSLTGVKAVASNLSFDQATGYQVVGAGNYEVFLTTPQSTSVNLSTGSLNLTANVNQTVVVLDNSAGGSTFLQLTDQ
ncbi:MAG TPA: DUF4397 domain-containing protein [Terriglobales bacterium]